MVWYGVVWCHRARYGMVNESVHGCLERMNTLDGCTNAWTDWWMALPSEPTNERANERTNQRTNEPTNE